MESLKFSIITPSFNQGMYIEQTIDSVLSQKGIDLEYIIIDGGSTDNTLEVIKKYEKHLKYWVSEPDRGHSHAINKGLLHCTGEVFNWLNSDDYYEPDALLKVAEAFQRNPLPLVVGGRERAFNDADQRTVEIYEGTNINKPIEQLIYEGIIDQPPTFFKKNVIDQLGFLPENLHYTMDAYWWTKFLLLYGKEGVVKILDVLTNFRLHEDSKTVSKQHLFEANRNAIRLQLYKDLQAPQIILNFFNTKTNILVPCILDAKISSPIFSKDKLFSIALYHALVFYYKNREYSLANIVLSHMLALGLFSIEIVPYIIKLKVLPQSLIEFLRS